MSAIKKVVAALAATAAIAVGTPSNAATVIALAPGVLTSPLSGGVANFDNPPLVSITTYGNSGPPQGTFSQGGATFSGYGILMTNSGQDSLGLYAEPYHDTTQYLTVRPNGNTETVTFGGGTYTQLGLYWGSMDTYNSIDFYNGAALVDTVTGTQAAAAVSASAQGLQGNDSNNRFIMISALLGGLGFDKIVINSTQNSFELDNLTWGGLSTGLTTPLPATLPLFATGIGALGLLGWRRKRKPVTFA